MAGGGPAVDESIECLSRPQFPRALAWADLVEPVWLSLASGPRTLDEFVHTEVVDEAEGDQARSGGHRREVALDPLCCRLYNDNNRLECSRCRRKAGTSRGQVWYG